MTVWVVRAGGNGEREDMALNKGLCFIGWGELPDLAKIKDKDAIKEKLQEENPQDKPKRIQNHSDQVWTFYKTIQKGDIVALPLKNRPAIAFGEVTGDYKFQANNPADIRHSRPIKWLGEPILRSNLDSDLRFSFGASQTVFSVQRNNAEERIRKILTQPSSVSKENLNDTEVDEPTPNLASAVSDQISDYIGRKFRGREMEKLIEAILKAKGYETSLCPEGSDGGIDILAGHGLMGFGEPKLCVQVKSGDAAIGREILDQLQGVMKKVKAAHGLLVSWGGFKSTVQEEARRNFFQIRLWNDKKIVEEIQNVYELLSPEIQTKLPLQKSWILVEDE